MTERNERDAHSVVIEELEPSWKNAPKRSPERRRKRRDADLWLLVGLLVLLILSAWWLWLA